MEEISTHKYLLGTCYTCKKCLYCFQPPQRTLCKCKKDKQPARVSNPKRGWQIYQRVFIPNQPLQIANEFLFTANTKFDYNSNFQEKFSYTFCTSCNSKFQRLRNKERSNNKKIQTNDELVNKLDKDYDKKFQTNDKLDEDEFNKDCEYNSEENNSNEENDDGESSNSEKDVTGERDIEDISEEEEDNSVEEVKVQIVIKKNNDKKMPIAKTLTVQPVSYENVMRKINSLVQKTLEKSVKPTNYTISYKAVNARGPPHELEDELDFQEFLDEYKKIVSIGKKMSVTVIVKDSSVKKNSKKKHSKSSDDNGGSSTEEEIELQPKKKKKSRAIREEDLSKEEKTRSEVIATLCERYKCNLHSTPCFIQDHRHLQLNPARLQIWAREIINKGTTYEIPPSFPTFDLKSSVSVKNNLAQTAQATQSTAPVTPIIIQLPPQYFQNSTNQEQIKLQNNANINLASPGTSHKLPTISEFFANLDQKYNCSNIYIKFIDSFIEEEITVNAIKDLSDEQLTKLGVVKIGWQKNIRQAAQQY